MTARALPTPAWLLPGASCGASRATILLQVGTTAHALRCPQELAQPALERLLADPQDRVLLGPVLHHPHSGTVYWWVRPGASATYPDGCRLLDRPASVPAPTAGPGAVFCTVATWLHLPAKAGILTGPVWLASALCDQERHHLTATGSAS